jgi:hypothetical protein
MRSAFLIAGLLASQAASADPMSAAEARRFVVGKVFAYSCFDGTSGTGRISGDGSAVGTIQSGSGPLRYAMLPPGTLRVKGQSVCASLRGMPFEPCFNLEKTSATSFRGSVSGLGFAYCDFTRRGSKSRVVRTHWRKQARDPVSLRPTTSASVD